MSLQEFLIILVAILVAQIQDADSSTFPVETTFCTPGSFELSSALLDWGDAYGEETLALEESCRSKMDELKNDIIGSHGPPAPRAVKEAMCSTACSSFYRNVVTLLETSECSCDTLDEIFALPSDVRTQAPSWCQRTPAFYLSITLDIHLDQAYYEDMYCRCKTLYCGWGPAVTVTPSRIGSILAGGLAVNLVL